MNSIRKELSEYRIEKAKSALLSARSLAGQGYWADSANRSYYAIFHALRAVLALDAFDSKKHSGVISYFLEHYIKTKLLDSYYPIMCVMLFLFEIKVITRIFT